jgi:hypothetical protein
MRHKSRRSGLLLLAATATALGLVGGIASATKPLHVVSVEYGLGGHRPGIDYRVDGYRPKPVRAEELPDYHNYVTPLKGTQPINAQGVALWPVNDRKVYHPLVIARYAIQMLHSYRVTKMNPAYLDRAEVNANWLIKHAVSRDGRFIFRTASPTTSAAIRTMCCAHHGSRRYPRGRRWRCSCASMH